MMGLLAPAFLIGILAIGLPIWLHRLQAQSSVRQSFSSAMLLETAQQQVHVKKKLKYLALLALRIALLAILALAFSKPFFVQSIEATTESSAGSLLVVIDTSASMNREGVFSQALSEAERAIDNAGDDVAIQVIAADNSIRLVTSLSNDKVNHRSALSGLTAGSLRLDYGEMMQAIDRLSSTLPAPVNIHFVSDFQVSGMPVRFSDLVPAGVAEFTPYVVGTGRPINWSLSYLRETADGLDVGVSGFGDTERLADIELIVNGENVESRSLTSAGQQTIRFELPELLEGDNRVEVNIESDDDLQTDNAWFHVVENSPPAEVPLLTYNPSGLPVTYLTAALESAVGSQFSVQPMIAGQFDARVLSRYPWLVVDDLGSIDSQLGASLTDYLRDGGNVLAFAGDRAAALETIPVTEHQHIQGELDIDDNRFLAIGQIDTGHQSLSATEGWHNVNVARSMPVEIQDTDQVLIRLENGEPFLVEQRVGDGRILLVLGGLDNRWNDLPVRPVFVSFIVGAAQYLSGINVIPKTYMTGSNLPLTLTGNTSGQVVDPDGNTILSLEATTREQQIKLNKPGFYEVYTQQGETTVAANIDPLESDLRTISQDVLTRWSDAQAGQEPGDVIVTMPSEQREPVAGEDRFEFWHWLLLLAAIVFIAESMLGNSYLTPRRLERG